jgi:hypothetical protein
MNELVEVDPGLVRLGREGWLAFWQWLEAVSQLKTISFLWELGTIWHGGDGSVGKV